MECPNCGRHLTSHRQRCTACGKAIPPAQHLLEESGVEPPSAPRAISAGNTVSRPICRIAPLGDRLIATALDHLVIFGMCAVAAVWSFTRWSFGSPSELHLTAASLLIAGLLGGAGAFLYQWLFEAAFQASLGKMIVGLRVVRTTPRGSMAACAIRNALRLIDGLGFYVVGALFAGCSELRRRLGDIVAGTAVVEETLPAGVKAIAIVVWTAAMVASACALPKIWAKPLPSDAPRYFGSTVLQIGSAPGTTYIRSARWRLELQFAPVGTPKTAIISVAHD